MDLFRTPVLVAAFILINLGNAHNVHIEKSESAGMASALDTSNLLSNLNGKIGLFKTYQDFVNNKPSKMKFIKWSYLYSGKTLKHLNAEFENTDGKKESIPCDEFWGFRSNDGLYRSFSFENGNVKAVAYRLNLIADGNFFWSIERLAGVDLAPHIRHTNGINGNEEKLSEKAKDAYKCVNDAYSKKGYSINWEEALPKYKNCSTLQYILDENYEGKVENTYLKSHDDVIKKYIAIHP